MSGVDRRSFLIGALGVSLGIATATVAADHEESEQSLPSSEVVSVEGVVYDEFADMCALDLTVDVAPSERIVIQNDLPGGTDRTIQNTGKRILRAVIPENSSVLVYAVNLDANTSKRLKTYHISDECEISEDVGTDGGERSQSTDTERTGEDR